MPETHEVIIPPDRVLRPEVRAVAARLATWDAWAHDSGQPTVCPELGKVFESDESKDPTIKPKRYAVGAGFLGLALPHIIEGDGPSARFKEWVSVRSDESLNPYAAFNRSVVATFQLGWQRFVESADPNRLERVRDRYNHLLAVDPTTAATGRPIGEEVFAEGVELGPELTYFGLMLGLARSKHSKLADADSDAMASVVKDVLPTLIRRGHLPLRFIFGGRPLYQTIKYDQIYLLERNGHWRLRSHDNLFDPYDPTRDPAPMGPTPGCMLDLVKIRETDDYTALENTIWAGVHELHAANLFDVQTAIATWQQHQYVNHMVAFDIEALRVTHASYLTPLQLGHAIVKMHSQALQGIMN